MPKILVYFDESGNLSLLPKMARSPVEVLTALRETQSSHELSIIKLSEPVFGALRQGLGERVSDVSADVLENPTPASLEADLAHYKACLACLCPYSNADPNYRSSFRNSVSHISNKSQKKSSYEPLLEILPSLLTTR